MHPILSSIQAPLNKLPGGCKPSYLPHLSGGLASLALKKESYFVIDQLLSKLDVQILLKLFASAPKVAQVDVLGKQEDHGLGSRRTSFWATKLAEQLYQLLLPYLHIREMQDHSRTDWWQDGFHRKWKPIGLSPLLRFMAYPKGSQHYPHYDAAYIYPDSSYRSLMSVLFYLTPHKESAATRLLNDRQDEIHEWERKHKDWQQPASSEIVFESVFPQLGRAFLFDHRILHDTALFEGDSERVLIRGDLVFEAI